MNKVKKIRSKKRMLFEPTWHLSQKNDVIQLNDRWTKFFVLKLALIEVPFCIIIESRRVWIWFCNSIYDTLSYFEYMIYFSGKSLLLFVRCNELNIYEPSWEYLLLKQSLHDIRFFFVKDLTQNKQFSWRSQCCFSTHLKESFKRFVCVA